MSLPLQFGSFHDRLTAVAVDECRIDTTADGLEGGVTQVPTELYGPAPALFIA